VHTAKIENETQTKSAPNMILFVAEPYFSDSISAHGSSQLVVQTSDSAKNWGQLSSRNFSCVA
jgi:hypothetical protein